MGPRQARWRRPKSGSKRPIEADNEAVFVLSLQLVFPDAKHTHASSEERAVHQPVADLVAGDLVAPELRVVLGFRAVDWTIVPEAAVDEHRQLLFG